MTRVTASLSHKKKKKDVSKRNSHLLNIVKLLYGQWREDVRILHFSNNNNINNKKAIQALPMSRICQNCFKIKNKRHVKNEVM